VRRPGRTSPEADDIEAAETSVGAARGEMLAADEWTRPEARESEALPLDTRPIERPGSPDGAAPVRVETFGYQRPGIRRLVCA
jgi:hypothetical protein